MATDTDPMATMQRRIAELETENAQLKGAPGFINPDAIREVALGRLGLNQGEHDLLQQVATEFEKLGSLDDLRMFDAWPEECPSCHHKDDTTNPQGIWWDHDGFCSNCSKSPIKLLQERIDRMAPYMPAPALGESKTDWLEAAYEERDNAVKLIDDLAAQIQKDQDDCMVCQDDDMPCLVCTEHARILGSIEGMRKRAKETG